MSIFGGFWQFQLISRIITCNAVCLKVIHDYRMLGLTKKSMVSLFYSIVIEHSNQNGFGPVSSMKMSEFGNFDNLWIFGSLLPLQLLLLFLFLSPLLPLLFRLFLLLPLFLVFPPLLLLPFLPHLDCLDYCLCAAAISGLGKKN